jgi:hypothetical protein
MGNHNIPDANLRDVFYRKIKDEPEMSYDINEYERMRERDPRKSYLYLKECVLDVIARQEQRKNLREREALLSAKPDKSADPTSDAAAAASPNKGEKKDKGQRGQSATPSSSGKTEMGTVDKNKTEASTSKDQKDKNKTGVAAKAKGEAKPSVKAAIEIPCYFFHNSTCLKGDACTFSHKALSDQKKQELVKPTKKDRSKTPDKGPKSDASVGTRLYCFNFYKSGT